MGSWIRCEECTVEVYATTSDPFTRGTFYAVHTLSGAEVGHYCCADHAQLGIQAWTDMQHEGADDEAAADIAARVEVFRKALMVEHGDDWDMETVSEAAHICAKAVV
jgi:hypothetical protein